MLRYERHKPVSSTLEREARLGEQRLASFAAALTVSLPKKDEKPPAPVQAPIRQR